MGTAAKNWCRRAASAVLVFALLFCGAVPALAADITTTTHTITKIPTAEGRAGDKLSNYTISGGEVQATTGGIATTVSGKFLWATPDAIPTTDSKSYALDFFSTGSSVVVVSVTIEVRINSSAMTADEINATVPTVDNIDGLRVALAASTNKNRIYESTIRRMSETYFKKYGYGETVDVSNSNASSNRMPLGVSSSYGAAMAAQGTARVKVYQERTTSGAVLQFDVDLDGGTRLDTPIVLTLGLPSGWNNSRDYYLRGSAGSPSVSISRSGGDRYYMTFMTDSLGTFKLFRDSDSNHDDDDDDDDYDVTTFWLDVIDAIADAGREENIRVNAGTRSTVPAEVLRELKGRAVTLSIRRTNYPTIIIYGKDVRSVPSDQDYYTMTTLANRYDTADSVSSAPCPTPVPPASAPAPAPPVYVPPRQVYVAPPPVYVAPSSASVSDVSSEESVSDDPSASEVLAEEDEPSSSAVALEQSSKAQESTGGVPADPLTFGLFVVLVLSLAAVASIGITLVMWNRRKI